MKLIAIVDDQSANRIVFCRLAREIAPAVEVEAFASPADALARFDAGYHPDLIITDFRMPGMDGPAFITAVRQKLWGHDVPVIVVTAYEDRDYRLTALRAGATDFLLSPVDHREFVTRGKNLLDIAMSRKQASMRALVLERELADSHRARETLLRCSRENLLKVIDTVPAMISATDATGRYVFVNRCLAESLGTTPEELTGTLATGPAVEEKHCSPEMCGVQAGLASCIGEQRARCTVRYEEVIRDLKGVDRVFLTSDTPLQGGSSDIPLRLRTSLDITDLKKAQQELHALAYRDQLTGAPNRLKVGRSVDALLRDSRSRERPFALLQLDLDRFKAINDTLGHSAGDRVLKSVAARLTEILPDAVIIGRLGGDEFGIVLRLTQEDREAEVRAAARRILDEFIPPFAIGDGSDSQSGRADDSVVITTASIGIVIHHGGPDTFDAILRRADMAMYKAKAIGGNSCRLFQPEMEKAEEAAMRIELDLHKAVARRELVLYYQPQLDLRSGRIVGVEALLRWRRADGTLLAPGAFLPVAEETGLIVQITEWVLDEACRQLASWAEEGMSVRMAVNMSGVLFRRGDVRGTVLDVIERTGINPNDLELELTESVLIANTDSANRQLEDLRKLGAAVAVDDFGTGYASLTYLSRLVIDRIKIDKSFIDRIEDSEADQAIVRSMITLCRNLGIRVTAEGIERPEQARWLAQQRCDEGQGFYFGRPQPADRVAAMIHASMGAWRQESGDIDLHRTVFAEGSELAP
ncbi:putative bifunctional diguanylate cyclase/phosphodiesterase [Acetobacter fallax]|uniref:EAL domain-containing protein n=1 Tax=Acetobacter fallax TaxID=1737473 RepID=A0ABX0K7D8_9PROT|nr:EAL domain-containing protein [Acetobacter fallax]NHO31379.1 EAL domain-containing protein [Acetobacter fallax]NHO35039.1 EAL domain-containing protein [Acetobacter fallax]